MPDEELFEPGRPGRAASQGTCEPRSSGCSQDPKAAALAENFAGQWLQTRNLEDSTPDPRQFPEFDEPLRAAMRKETELFFEVDRAGGPQRARLPRRRLHLRQRATGPALRHPGRVRARQFRRVTLAGHAARRRADAGQRPDGHVEPDPDLAGEARQVDPGEHPRHAAAAAAAGCAELKRARRHDRDGTLRQRMEQHRADPSCASCHAPMDPLGFGLENFDAIGAWRDRRTASSPIDAVRHAARRQAFNGPAELQEDPANARPTQFARCLAEKMLTYALGRGVESYDRRAVDGIVDAARSATIIGSRPGAGDRQERPVPEARARRKAMQMTGTISRRTVLRGLGTAVALPWLEAMTPRTAGRPIGRPARARPAHGVPLRPQRHPHARLDAASRRARIRAAARSWSRCSPSRTTCSS